MNQPYTPDTYTPAGHGRATVQVPLPRRMIETELSGDFTLPDYHPEIKRLFTWVDADGSVVQVLFGSDEKLEEVSFYFAEPAAAAK